MAAGGGMSAAQYIPTTKLVSLHISGNLHSVASYVTKFGLSDFFVQADSSGFNSIALFRLPTDWPVDQHGPVPATGKKGGAAHG